MWRIRKMRSSATVVKMNTGRRRWLKPTPYPPWDAVQKCPLWSAEEWKGVRSALSKPVPTGDVEPTDAKVVVSGTRELRPRTRTTMIQGQKSSLCRSSRAVVCQLPLQQEVTQRFVAFLVHFAVSSWCCRRNALHSVPLPGPIKIGMSNCVLIVDSLGTGTRW